MSGFDRIQCTVIQNRLTAITRDMGTTMLRTSRSPILTEARDFITAVFDEKGRVAAQTEYIPILCASTPEAVKKTSEAFEGEIREGDLFLLNDPFCGGNHLPDLTVLKPVFSPSGRRLFWAVTKGHHADIGGAVMGGYNPGARDAFQEGIRIPPIKLYDRGRRREDIWRMLLSNTRLPGHLRGDLRAQISAVGLAERLLKEMVSKWGEDTLREAIEFFLDATERRVRREISAIPDGTYRACRALDHDGIDKSRRVRIDVEITVESDRMVFDYSRSDPQTKGFVNSSLPNTVSASLIGLFTIIDPEIPHNEGCARPVEVIAPPSLVVNARPPAPTSLCTLSTAEAIIEAVWLALSDAVPERISAAWGRVSGPNISGVDPRTGEGFSEITFLRKNGGGAAYGFDGWSHVGTVVCCGGVRAPSIEMHEMDSPLFLLKHEYRMDSGGPGRWRGGLGVDYVFRVDAPAAQACSTGDGMLEENRAFGLAGGLPGETNRVFIRTPDGERIDVDSKSVHALQEGCEITIHSSGGGGWGAPRERDPELVASDVRNGFISPESARRDSGVVLDAATGRVDEEATGRARRALAERTESPMEAGNP